MGEIQGNGPTYADYVAADVRDLRREVAGMRETVRRTAETILTTLYPRASASKESADAQDRWNVALFEHLAPADKMKLAAKLIEEATGYEPVCEDGEYLTTHGAPNPHYRVMRLVSVDHVAECMSPADRERYLRSKGHWPERACSFCGGSAGRLPKADGYRCAACPADGSPMRGDGR